MKHIKKVPGCAWCPFSTTSSAGGYGWGFWDKGCVATMWLDRDDPEMVGRPFEVEKDFGNHTATIFPQPPPDWCPLREGPFLIKLELKQ